ncbi:hypothetical protein D3C81_2322040 [compost metagenome]
MIGMVVPAHNEQALLGHYLATLKAAAWQARQAGEHVEILVHGGFGDYRVSLATPLGP